MACWQDTQAAAAMEEVTVTSARVTRRQAARSAGKGTAFEHYLSSLSSNSMSSFLHLLCHWKVTWQGQKGQVADMLPHLAYCLQLNAH